MGAPLKSDEGECEQCFELIDDLNVEAWELSGKFLCADCADAFFETQSESDQ